MQPLPYLFFEDRVYKCSDEIAVVYTNSFKGRMFWRSMDNYQKLVERIAQSQKITVEEIDRKVEAKRAKLSGLVSKEGAAQIVAAELGINFEQEKLKLSEIVPGMRRVNTVAKIIKIFPVRSYEKNGRSGKVCNMLIADDSSNVRAVLWDTNHISLIEKKELVEGDVVSISNASIREGEVHLSSFGEIKKSDEKIKSVISEKVYSARNLKEASAGQVLQTRAFIVQSFEPRYFEVCPECKKKAVSGECAVHGKVSPEKRALLTLVIDDGSESIRAVLFADAIKSLGITDEELFSLEAFAVKKHSLLGEELNFYGSIRSNQLYNTSEMIIDRVEKLDPGMLIQVLERK